MLKRLSFLGFFILVGFTSTLSQEAPTELKDKRVSIQMTEKSLYTVFNRLINKYDIAIGFEESALDRAHSDYYFETNIPLDDWPDASLAIDYSGRQPEKSVTPEKRRAYGNREVLPPTRGLGYQHLITVDSTDATLDVVLDAIVKQMKHYDWEINDDVVNIFPVEGRDPRLKKLLDMKVRSFAVGRGADVGSIQAQLMLFLPEFKEFIAENDLHTETARLGSVWEDRVLPDGMNFSNLTFKELLNAITRSKRGGWILRIKKQTNEPGKEFVEILI